MPLVWCPSLFHTLSSLSRLGVFLASRRHRPGTTLSIFLQDPPRSLGRIFSVALVPVKLLLKAGLGILDASQCAQRSLECLTAHRADSNRWSASKILNDSKRASCHVRSLAQATSHFVFQVISNPLVAVTAPAAVIVNHRLIDLQFHGPAKFGMVFVVEGHKTKGLQEAKSRFSRWLQDLGHTTNHFLACLKRYLHEVTRLKRFREDKQSASR
jgi:hypothetical protein